MTATGKIASDKMMYRIENSNTSSVNIEILCGSSNYTYTIAPQSVAYFAGSFAEAQIGISGEPFAISSPSGGYAYEGMAWLSVTPLSTTATTANFELYNRDDATHTFVMRNAGGTENSYTLAAYESRTVTLANENWEVYTTVWDPTGMMYGPQYDNIYTGPAFGDATYCNNGLLKVATAIPGSSIVPNATSGSVTSSTSITINGTITNNAFASGSVDYYFIYGTDPGNLNQSTANQNITVPAQSSVTVNATLTGLTAETMYYFKLVAATNPSSAKKILLSTAIPTTNLKLHLRSDLAVTSASSAVSAWGDLSGWNNDASQGTSGNQPIVAESAINAKPALSFNGTTSKLTLPTSTSLGIQSNPYELFIVAKSSSGNVQFLIAGGAYEQFEYHLNGAAGARFIPTTSVYIDKSTTGSYTNGSAHLFSARASATGGAVRVDGIDGVTTGSNILSSNSANLMLGVRSDGTYYFNGDIAEVIIYNRILTESERDSVEQYLDNRYQTGYNQKPEFTSTSFTVAEDTLLAGLLATDADGDLLSYTILRNGVNGTAYTQHDSLYYMPAPDFNGNDSLHITVSDGLQFDTAWVYITVTPVNDAPVLHDLSAATVEEDGLYSDMLATDVEGDLLSYTILRNGVNGTAHTQHDSLYYMPAPDFNGDDSLHITVSDGLLSDTAWVYITVTPVNDAPVTRDTLVEATVAIATPINLSVSDIDGTISAVFIHRDPVNGTATVSGTSLSYTSDTGFSGNDTIAWYARDNEGAFSDTAMLIIHVNPSEIAVDLSVSDTTLVDGTTTCFNAENEITVAGSSTVTIENNATANFIAGTSVRFLPGFHAANGSVVHGWITTDGTFCDAAGGSSIVILPEMKSHDLNIPNEKQNILDEFQVKIVPNPNNGQFRITLSGAQMNQSEVKVYNQLGKLVYSKKLFFQSDVEIAINNATPGLYLVKTTSGKNITTRKIIIN
jgi:hypothetical protein